MKRNKRKKKIKARNKQINKIKKQKAPSNLDYRFFTAKKQIKKKNSSNTLNSIENNIRVKKFQSRLPKTFWEFFEDLFSKMIKQPFKKLMSFYDKVREKILIFKNQISLKFKKDN